MWLKIQNSGTDLPEKAFTLMGATTKDGVSSIGMFGSGNKYSIATLLRLNIPFKVFVSDQEIVFDTKKINFKEKEFDLILVNGKETDLTTSMGKDWNEWFIVREFVSNALDEANAEIELVEMPLPVKDYTTIYIEATNRITNIFNEKKKYFSYDRTDLIYEDDVVKLFPPFAESPFVVFRKGIKCLEMWNKSVYTYDFKNIKINEYREADSWDVTTLLVKWYVHKAPVEVIKKLLLKGNNNKDLFEYSTSKWLSWDTYNSNWEEALSGKRIIPIESAGFYQKEINVDTDILVPDSLYQALTSCGLKIDFIGDKNPDKRMKDLILNNFQQAMYDKAIHFLNETGYVVKYDIKLVEFDNRLLYGMFANNTIYVGDKSFSSTNELINTIIEENEHGISGHEDYTPEFQKHLINLLINEKSNRFAYVL